MRNVLKTTSQAVIVALLAGCTVSQPTQGKVENSLKEEAAEAPHLAEQEETIASGTVVVADEVPQVLELPEYRAAKRRLHDLIHTKLELSFDWENEYVLGVAQLKLTPYFYPQDTLVLDAKGFIVNSVNIIDGDSKTNAEFSYDNMNLVIQLDKTYLQGEHYWVEIDYTARPAEVEGFGSEAIQGEQGLYFINADGSEDKPQQIWTQGETEFSSCWFPTIDAPNEKSTQEVYLTVDRRFTTLSNGLLVSSRDVGANKRVDYWKMDLPHAPYLFMIAVGEFSVIEDTWQGKPVQYYVEPAFAKYARNIFGNTPEMMSFFSEKLGVDYPWPKYAQVVVRDFVSGAMENTSASVFMEDLQQDSRSLLDEHREGIIAHELFHHWFGDLVTCESWSNLPLNESFANYSEYLWIEYKYGKDSAEYHAFEEFSGYLEEAEGDAKTLIRFIYDDPGDMFDRHSYNKGGRVLHMLRNYVGDEAFFKALQVYLTENAYQAVELHQLRMAFEKVTGEDLNWFFNQWFLSPGHPLLTATHHYEAGQLQVTFEQLQDFASFPLFELSITIEVWEGGTAVRHTVKVDRSYQTFTLNASTKPDLVLIDPDKVLLAEIKHELSKDMYLHQAQHATHFYHRLIGLTKYAPLATSFEEVIPIAQSFLNDPFWVNRSVAIGSFDEYDGPVQEEVIEQLKKIAISDPVPGVRAEALTALGSISGFEDVALVKSALNDSSYTVVGAALDMLLNQGMPPVAVNDMLEPFHDYMDIRVVIAIADYYVSRSVAGKADWLSSKLKAVQGEDRYYLLPYVSEYLLPLSPQEQKNALEVLFEIAKNDANYYVRAATVNALEMLDTEGELESQINAIKEAETDPRFFEFYGE